MFEGVRSVPNDEIFNWFERERNAKRVHTGSTGETIKTWLEGFNLVHSNLSRASGIDLTEEQRFMVGLIASSINSMKCILDLTITGYFLQAMNLARILIEIEVMYWYIRIFPQDFRRFQHPNRSVPKFDDMRKKIQSCPEETGLYLTFGRAARNSMREFSNYSHVAISTVGSVTNVELDKTRIAFGPKIDEHQCFAVLHDTLPLVVGILACTSNLLDFAGSGPIEDFTSYADKARSVRERDSVAPRRD